MAVASDHRSRSISVVTLLGSPRRTSCSAPFPGFPASFPAMASKANPRAGSGRIAGTTAKTCWPRIRSTWSRRSVAVAPAGTASAARSCSPTRSARRSAASGRRRPRIKVSGTFARAATGATWRRSGHGDPMVTENLGSAKRLRSTVAERASMMSNTRGTIARPALLRTTGVRSKNMRCPASAYGAGPSRGTGTGKCAAPATEDAISRMPARPIGVRGRVSPWARLKHK
ncbi:hypothetical protein SRABI128_06092 [Microbacterium sp. Bi128]|nr:hypothetical protein SRABI128_06092 [Microbacterium sp. Bi128]